jgi:hypothetical protein
MSVRKYYTEMGTHTNPTRVKWLQFLEIKHFVWLRNHKYVRFLNFIKIVKLQPVKNVWNLEMFCNLKCSGNMENTNISPIE